MPESPTPVLLATVHVFNDHGVEFKNSEYKFLQLTYTLNNDHISLEPLTSAQRQANCESQSPCTGRQYKVHGLTTGYTSLTFSVYNEGPKGLLSAPLSIQVFPPLRISPRHVLLTPGRLVDCRMELCIVLFCAVYLY